MNRKHFLSSLLAVPFMCACGSSGDRQMVVYKSPTCGCCGAWIKHLTSNGFVVEIHDTNDIVEYGRGVGVPDELRSCHTGLIGGYAIEGHVPAEDIKRLLSERPDAKGLAVPGMPMGSPGMEGAYIEPYSVLLFDDDGRSRVFQSYGG
jgi:hypothetical protein